MKKTDIAKLVILMAVCLSSGKSFCQATIPADTIKNMLIKEWERAKSYTQEYMAAMPADKYSFRATDSVRSFAQQLLHLSNATLFFVSTATGAKRPYNGPDLEKSTTAQSADSVRYYVNQSYDFAISELRNLPASSLMQRKTFNMGRSINETVLMWFLKAFEHQTHHRGQTTVYLRLAGVHPPQERLF